MTATVLQESEWIRNKKKFYYVCQYLGIILPSTFAYLVWTTGNGDWFLGVPIIFYFGIAIFDLIFGVDLVNPTVDDEEQLKNDSFYDNVLMSLVPLYVLTYCFIAYVVATVSLSAAQFAYAVIGVGAMFSGVFVVTHELGHRTKHSLQSFFSRIVIALFGYGHFHVEHNRGHHVHVSTPEDAASARMGENVYQFMLREIPSTIMRAFQLESTRLERLGLGFWSVKNEILQSYAMTLALYAGLTVVLGASIIPFLLLSIFIGYFQLSMANYFEHYGLLREKLENGRYAKCEPEHSWNSHHTFSNALTLQLQRHSDHHANATRPYQILRDYDDAPQLPAGYPFLEFVCVFPPLWRRLMDRRLLSYVGYDMNKVNVCPKKRDALFEKYHMKQPA
ncbi:MAG: alkane 1-monooxygenase [Pseudomonadota bacterium]